MTHLAVQRARLDRDASVRSLGVAFGARLARAEVETVLEGDGSSSEMLGCTSATPSSTSTTGRSRTTWIRTSSDLLYKGAMRDASNAIYTGTVVIEKGAHRCDAYQTNRNILLSEHAGRTRSRTSRS